MSGRAAGDVDWRLRCTATGAVYGGLEPRVRSDSGGILEVELDLAALRDRVSTAVFDARLGSKRRVDRSGVWRFRELILPLADDSAAVTKPEGNTNLYDAPTVARYVGLDALALKHEGENPTGSFKDRGMTVAATIARLCGATRVACASTGNTSASMAAYAAAAGMQSFVFIPDGKIAYGKLAQALAYGAKTIQIRGDFDRALDLVQQVCERSGVYLMNSVNPFRIEGQKSILFELLQDRDWRVPDWIVLPGGNLGNSAALGKGLRELLALGIIDRLPKIGVVQAEGASPFVRAFRTGEDLVPTLGADTLATAIRIGNPVSWRKSLRGVQESGGVVTSVTDLEILDAKAHVDRAGIGAEPASCATVAGIRQLVASGHIPADADVVGILTGHVLKDPEIVVAYHRGELGALDEHTRNRPVQCDATLAAVMAQIES